MSDTPRVFAVSDNTTEATNAQSAPETTPLIQMVGVVVATVLVLAVLAVVYLSGDKTMLNTVVVAILGYVGIVFNFQYGSSAGSHRKDAVIASKGRSVS